MQSSDEFADGSSDEGRKLPMTRVPKLLSQQYKIILVNRTLILFETMRRSTYITALGWLFTHKLKCGFARAVGKLARSWLAATCFWAYGTRVWRGCTLPG